MPSRVNELPLNQNAGVSKSADFHDLARTIYTNTGAIKDYLLENNLPFPSFSVDGPLNLGITSPEVEKSRHVAIDALQELLDLLQGPVTCMTPNWNATALQVISRHDIARKVPLEGMISMEDLAEKCDLRVQDLRRVIRFAKSYHRLFDEPKEGFVAHSLGSKLLAEDEIMRAAVAHRYVEFYPGYAKTAEALDLFKDQEPNHTGLALAHGTNESLFEYYYSHPEKADQFAKAMRCWSKVPSQSVNYLVNGYDWKSFANGTVIDVGGADGYVSLAIAKEFPDLNLIIQDLPAVTEGRVIECDDEDVISRVKYQPHNMFTPQPTSADAYLFRWVFHDWPDHYVVRALKNLVPALRKGAKVIVNESLSPKPNSLPLSVERAVCAMDMIMLTANNSRLRSVEDWGQLFKTADPRFGSVKCTKPEGSALAILEVAWED